MKVIAISRDKRFYKIGENSNDSDWYEVTDKVSNFAKNIERGDEVAIKYNVQNVNGREVKVLDFIGKESSTDNTRSSSSTPKSYSSSTKQMNSGRLDSGGRTDSVGRSIERQAIMKAACEAVKTMPGQFGSVDDLWNTIDTLYTKMITKITS